MRAWCVALAIAVASTQASAQALLTGPPSSDVVAVGPLRLHLPAGPWQEITQIEGQAYFNGGTPGQTPTFRRLYIQTENGKVGALLVVGGNTALSMNGWTPPKMCTRTDTYWSGHRDGWTNNFDCALVTHVVMREGARTTVLMKAAYDTVRDSGGMPRQMIRAGFADATTTNAINVSVYFNPELAGLHASDPRRTRSEWQTSNLDAAHKAYLDKVVAWATSYRTFVRQAIP